MLSNEIIYRVSKDKFKEALNIRSDYEYEYKTLFFVADYVRNVCRAYVIPSNFCKHPMRITDCM